MFFSQRTNALAWANTKQYQQANQQLLAQPRAPHTQRVVFMGDSITEGWGKLRPAFFNTPGYVNRGIGGQTTPQMLLRFRPDVIALAPDVVVLLAGINDIAENTGPMPLEQVAGNLFSMAELAQANGILVVLCAVLPAYDFGWSKNKQPAPKVLALNQLIATYAQQKGHPFVDYYSPLADERGGLPRQWAPDGIHPNANCYALMEPLVQAGIAQAIN